MGYFVHSMMLCFRTWRIFSVLLCFSLPLNVFAKTSNDPRFSESWYLDAIRAPAAWDVTTGVSTMVVAVLDTGVDLDHEDLAGNIWRNSDEIAGNGKDDDRNGFIDDVQGWDFIDHDADPSPNPTHRSLRDATSHGTLIAGEIGAVGNNSLGTVGVNWRVQIMPIRMLDEQGGGTENTAAEAIRYAVKNGARVINLSFAGNEVHSALQSAVKDAFTNGVVVVAALGNESRNADASPVYPACLRTAVDDWVIGVTASDEDDRGASFTNYGKTCADIAAPGMNIFGLGYENVPQGYVDAYVGPWDGTSMASPLVAGAAALLLAEYPSLSATDVRNILKLSVDPLQNTGYSAGALGAGRLNVVRALALATAYAPATSETSERDEIDTQISTETSSNAFVVFGAPAGAPSEVRVFRDNGEEYAQFVPYSSTFRGGVHVAMMNNDADATPEIITGAGDGGGPHVRIFTANGILIDDFFAYNSASRRGVNIAVGDVSGDGEKDIVTAVGAGVSQDIVVWTEKGEELLRFTADLFPASSTLSVATIDYDNDVAEEIAVAGVIDGVARIALYDNDGKYVVDFSPYSNLNALSMVGIDLDGDLYDELLVSPLAQGSEVREFTKIGALRSVISLEGHQSVGNILASLDSDSDGRDNILALENVDAGVLTVLASDQKTVLDAWRAPSFHSTVAPFLSAW